MCRTNDYLWYIIGNIGANLTNIRNAEGDWLTIMALGFYDISRNAEIATVGTISATFSNVGVTSTTFVNPSTGVVYSATNDGTTGTKSIHLTAQTTGEVGNCIESLLVSQNSTVSINSPVSDTSWISTFGTPPETDGQLRQRCLDRLIGLGASSHADALALILKKETSGQITRCRIYRNQNTGSPVAVIAASSGLATSAQLARCATALAKYTAPDTVISAVSASNQTINIGGVFSFTTGTTNSVVQSVFSHVKKYLNELEISDGSDNSSITLYELQHQINVTDSTNALNYAQLLITTYTDPLNPGTPINMLDSNSYITRYENTVFAANVTASTVFE
jgi:hypothetical protein